MKNNLRKIAKEKRFNLKTIEHNKKIQELFLNLSEYKIAKNILTYYSFNNEVDTLFCFKDITKNWYLPKINKDKLLVCPYNKDNLTKNKFNLIEPNNEPITDTSIIDMVVIPCIASDIYGYRLGYGKGYYDRFLPTLNKSTMKVILCYSDLLYDTVFPEKFDIPANIIVTDKEIYRINC